MQTVDVVIPTGKNIAVSNYSICYTIKSILSQNYKVNNIFIVENSYNSDTKRVLEDTFGDFVQVLNGLSKTPNISYARNIGAQAGSSDIILFMDDDVVIGRNNFLTEIMGIISDRDFCCGALRYWTSIDWDKYLSLDYQMSHNLQILKEKSFLPYSIDRNSGRRTSHNYSYIGNFGAIKRSVFEENNGFDEEYKGWLFQDTDLMMRLCANRHSYEILSSYDIYCYHLAHPANKETYRERNQNRYEDKQKEMGIIFSSSNFFGNFQTDDMSVVKPILK